MFKLIPHPVVQIKRNIATLVSESKKDEEFYLDLVVDGRKDPIAYIHIGHEDYTVTWFTDKSVNQYIETVYMMETGHITEITSQTPSEMCTGISPLRSDMIHDPKDLIFIRFDGLNWSSTWSKDGEISYKGDLMTVRISREHDKLRKLYYATGIPGIDLEHFVMEASKNKYRQNKGIVPTTSG